MKKLILVLVGVLFFSAIVSVSAFAYPERRIIPGAGANCIDWNMSATFAEPAGARLVFYDELGALSTDAGKWQPGQQSVYRRIVAIWPTQESANTWVRIYRPPYCPPIQPPPPPTPVPLPLLAHIEVDCQGNWQAVLDSVPPRTAIMILPTDNGTISEGEVLQIIVIARQENGLEFRILLTVNWPNCNTEPTPTPDPTDPIPVPEISVSAPPPPAHMFDCTMPNVWALPWGTYSFLGIDRVNVKSEGVVLYSLVDNERQWESGYYRFDGPDGPIEFYMWVVLDSTTLTANDFQCAPTDQDIPWS